MTGVVVSTEHARSINLTNRYLVVYAEIKTMVFNIHLVYRELRTASFEPFVQILNYCRFRLTKAGLEDLQCVGTAGYLAKRITKLTFGTGQVDPRIEGAADMREKSGDSSYDMVFQHVNAISEACRCIHLPDAPRLAQEKLARALTAFPSVAEVSVIGCDKTDFLGG